MNSQCHVDVNDFLFKFLMHIKQSSSTQGIVCAIENVMKVPTQDWTTSALLSSLSSVILHC